MSGHGNTPGAICAMCPAPAVAGSALCAQCKRVADWAVEGVRASRAQQEEELSAEGRPHQSRGGYRRQRDDEDSPPRNRRSYRYSPSPPPRSRGYRDDREASPRRYDGYGLHGGKDKEERLKQLDIEAEKLAPEKREYARQVEEEEQEKKAMEYARLRREFEQDLKLEIEHHLAQKFRKTSHRDSRNYRDRTDNRRGGRGQGRGRGQGYRRDRSRSPAGSRKGFRKDPKDIAKKDRVPGTQHLAEKGERVDEPCLSCTLMGGVKAKLADTHYLHDCRHTDEDARRVALGRYKEARAAKENAAAEEKAATNTGREAGHQAIAVPVDTSRIPPTPAANAGQSALHGADPAAPTNGAVNEAATDDAANAQGPSVSPEANAIIGWLHTQRQDPQNAGVSYLELAVNFRDDLLDDYFSQLRRMQIPAGSSLQQGNVLGLLEDLIRELRNRGQ